jgi:hypothetical protein
MKKFNHVISLLFDIVLTSFEIVNNIDDMFICVKTNIGGCSERYSERRPHRIYSEKQGMSVVSLSSDIQRCTAQGRHDRITMHCHNSKILFSVGSRRNCQTPITYGYKWLPGQTLVSLDLNRGQLSWDLSHLLV